MSGGINPGVKPGGTILFTPASLPVSTMILTVTTAGVMQATVSTADFDAAGTAAGLVASEAGTRAAADSVLASAITAHEADMTNVHGIADTSALALTTNHPSNATFNDHSARHESGGGDAIKIDDLSAPDDNTDLNATTSAHGLLPKLGGGSTNFLRADGTWSAPSAGSPGGSSGQVQYNNAGAFGGFAGHTVSTSSPNNVFTAQAANHVPVVTKGAASHSANLLEGRNSSDTLLWNFSQTELNLNTQNSCNRICFSHFGNGFHTSIVGTNGGNSSACSLEFRGWVDEVNAALRIGNPAGGDIGVFNLGNGVFNGTDAAVAASPRGGMVSATSGSGTNIAGASLYLAGGRGTGTGVGGSVILQVAAAGSTGTTLNSLTNAVTVSSTGLAMASSLLVSAIIDPAPYTFATVPSASAYSGKGIRITDRAQRWAYSDGTNWRFVADDVIIS